MSWALALAALRGEPVAAVAGIANPAQFFGMLQDAGLALAHAEPLPPSPPRHWTNSGCAGRAAWEASGIGWLQMTPAGRTARLVDESGARAVPRAELHQKVQNPFPGPVFAVQQRHRARANSSGPTIEACASTQLPAILPRMSHGAILAKCFQEPSTRP